MKHIKSSNVFFLVFLILSSISIIPFFSPGFFPMHDNTQVARVYEMFLSLKSGMFPVRWVMDLGYGYGYPIFTFYAPLAYYVGAVFIFVGFDALMATKIMMILGTVMAGVSMYFLGKEIWDEEGGFVAGLLYLLAPYHAVNIYVRGAVAEFWAMAFLPLVFYGIVKFYKTNKWRYVVVSGLAYAGVITSHNLTAMMITPFIGVVLLFCIGISYKAKNWVALSSYVVLFLLGLSFSAFYWIPALSETSYTNVQSQISGTGSKFKDHFVCLGQLWESPWGYAGSGPGCVDGMSFRIGKLHILLTILALFSGLFIYRKDKTKGVILLIAGLFFFLSVFLTVEYSSFIWYSFSAMSYFQFPWRFLLLCVFFSSFLAGSIIWMIKHSMVKQRIIMVSLVGVLSVVAIVLYGKHFKPQMITNEKVQDMIETKVIRWTTSKISDEYMPKNFIKPTDESEIVTNKVDVIRGEGRITQSSDLINHQQFTIQASTPVTLLLKTAPFPAWKVFNGQSEIPYQATNQGMMVMLEEGNHALSVRYISTQIEKLGNFISLTSMVVLLIGIIYLHKKHML